MTEPDLSLTAFNEPRDPLSAREAANEERREQFSLEERERMSKPKLSLVDLINHIGMEHVKVQPLLPSITGATTSKKGITKITFETRDFNCNDLVAATESFGDTERAKDSTIGLILWLPKDRLPK